MKTLRVAVLLLACQLTIALADHYEVFLLAGQSNMDGRGAVVDLKEDLDEYAKANPEILLHFSAGGLNRPLTVSDGFKPLAPGYSGTTGKKPDALPTGNRQTLRPRNGVAAFESDCTVSKSWLYRCV